MTRYALKHIADDSVIRYAEFNELPPVLAEAKGLVWVESPIIVTEPTLVEIKANKVLNIKEKRDYLTINGGHKIGVNWYHSNELSLIQQLVLDGIAKQMVAAGASDLTPLTGIPAWKTLNGPAITLTVGIAKNFVMSAMLQQGALFATAAAKITEVEAFNTITEVLDYDIDIGWPETATI